MKLSDLRALLDTLSFRPSKMLGQNFLHDSNVARAIVADANPQPGETIIEIGPGFGALTRPLLETGARVIAIEKDFRIAGWLATEFSQYPNFEVRNADAVVCDVTTFLPMGPLRVIGNLPYSVSTPMLFHWAEPPIQPLSLTFALQKEVAERICARRDTADYSPLSIMVQSRHQASITRALPPQLFHPVPGVDSSVISLTPLPPGTYPPVDFLRLRKIVARAFQTRRKKVAKALAEFGISWPDLAPQLGRAEGDRPEDLSVADWIAVANHGRNHLPAQAPETERFDLVDENDVVIGNATRGEIHDGGLRHRAVHLFIYNSAGYLWLQKRSLLKDRHPGVWDSSAAGHVDSGETYDVAAKRELQEEMGVQTPIHEVGSIAACEATGNEFVRIYRGVHEGPFELPPAEIAFGAFVHPDVISRWLKERPEDFAPGFVACWTEVSKRV